MGRLTRVSIIHRRALNQVMLYTGRAPAQAFLGPHVLVRALRSALRMSQAHLARRCGIPQAHLARLESGAIDVQLKTLRRLFDALFCDVLILPKPRTRPGDAIAERDLDKPRNLIWKD